MKKRRRVYVGLLVVLFIVLTVAIFFKKIAASETKESWFFSKSEQKTAKNEEEFIQAVYEGMLNKEEEITIVYSGKDYKDIHNTFLDQIIKKVFEKDDKTTSDDFDYMNYNLDEIGIHTKADLFHFVTITITPKWKESKEETVYVNQKVQEILSALSLSDDSDYDKIKKIHDYIVKKFEYDETLHNYTAYKAIQDGTTICQGYMLLTYKLLTEAGIETKCIDGMGTTLYGTQSHGWNLVKLNRKWYNLDVTWDDPVLIGSEEAKSAQEIPISYQYFLKGTESFSKDHERNEKFMTSEFLSQYPVSYEDYTEEETEGIEEEITQEITEEDSALNDSNQVVQPMDKKEADSEEKKEDFSGNLQLFLIIFIGLCLLSLLVGRTRRY